MTPVVSGIERRGVRVSCRSLAAVLPASNRSATVPWGRVGSALATFSEIAWSMPVFERRAEGALDGENGTVERSRNFEARSPRARRPFLR